jgi:DNA (cytosine-5)-methyltransferase 1
MKQQVVVSLFPGIGMLDMAFEEEGFCVVRGPDRLWGGDIRRFHVPRGRFDGVIGGPPCKGESTLAALNGAPGTLRHEFMRIVTESGCAWWIMEAVKKGSAPHVLTLNNRWLGEVQHRKRYFHSNLALTPEVAALEHPHWKYAVLASHGGGIGSIYRRMAKYSLPDACELQGLPRDFTDSLPFTRQWKYEVIGNGVPLPMGRAVARAVKRALGIEAVA